MKKTEVLEIFISAYKRSQLYDGMLPTNSPLLDFENNLEIIYQLIKDGKVERRECEGGAYQLTKAERDKINLQPTPTTPPPAGTEKEKQSTIAGQELKLVKWVHEGFPPLDLNGHATHVKALVNSYDQLKAANESLRENNERLLGINKELVSALEEMMWGEMNGEYEAQKQGRKRLTERMDQARAAVKKAKQ